MATSTASCLFGSPDENVPCSSNVSSLNIFEVYQWLAETSQQYGDHRVDVLVCSPPYSSVASSKLCNIFNPTYTVSPNCTVNVATADATDRYNERYERTIYEFINGNCGNNNNGNRKKKNE